MHRCFNYLILPTILLAVLVVMPATHATANVNLYVGDGLGTPGGTVDVQLTVDVPSEIAGAALTITCDAALTLSEVNSDFFETFAIQWTKVTPTPDPMPPNSVEVGGENYEQPLIHNGNMIAAARFNDGQTESTLFTFTFTIASDAPYGKYQVGIEKTNLNNTDAGYAAGGEDIEMLYGSDLSQSDLTQAFPVIIVDGISAEAGTAGGVMVSSDDTCEQEGVNADSDCDGILDSVENTTSPTDVFNPDSDGDGYLDGEEDTNGNGVIDPGESDPMDENDVPSQQEKTIIIDMGDGFLIPLKAGN